MLHILVSRYFLLYVFSGKWPFSFLVLLDDLSGDEVHRLILDGENILAVGEEGPVMGLRRLMERLERVFEGTHELSN